MKYIYFLLKNSCKKNILLIWPSLTFKWVVKNQKLTLRVRFRGFLTTRSYVSESQIKKMFFYNWFSSKNLLSVDPCSQNYTSEITLIIIHSNSKIHNEKKNMICLWQIIYFPICTHQKFCSSQVFQVPE